MDFGSRSCGVGDGESDILAETASPGCLNAHRLQVIVGKSLRYVGEWLDGFVEK